MNPMAAIESCDEFTSSRELKRFRPHDFQPDWALKDALTLRRMAVKRSGLN